MLKRGGYFIRVDILLNFSLKSSFLRGKVPCFIVGGIVEDARFSLNNAS